MAKEWRRRATPPSAVAIEVVTSVWSAALSCPGRFVPALAVERPPARGEHGAGEGTGKGWRRGKGTERKEHATDLGAVDEIVVHLDFEELDVGHVERGVREPAHVGLEHRCLRACW
jgi:hypothetical protein